MPNWCHNVIEISHDDEKWWHWLCQTQFDFQKIVPCPSIPTREDYDENDEPWNYNWSAKMWGTKWKVDPDTLDWDWDIEEKGSMEFGFQTAWSPPFGIYKALHLFGFKIRASYLEEGMDFCGIWDNNELNKYISDFDDEVSTSYRIGEMIPSDITSIEKWEEYIKQNPLDENEKQILVDYDYLLEERIEYQAEAEAEAECD